MELPEVQTIVDDLRKTVLGLQIKRASVVDQRCIVSLSEKQFKKRIQNRIVVDVQRYGKYIGWTFNDSQSLLLHLRMTGQLHYSMNGPAKSPYLGIIFWFQNGATVSYYDKLKWGRLYLLDLPTSLDSFLSNFGPDLLKGEIACFQFCEILRNAKVSIHSFLLNQKNLVGVGNIYANEALFKATIHPQRLACSLSKEEGARLYNAIITVLNDAIRCRGTTFSDYRDLFGKKGRYQEYLQVFKRDDQPCYQCGALIRRGKLHNRSIFFCPNCQGDTSETKQ